MSKEKNLITYIRKLKDGKSQVMKELAFSTLLDKTLPNETKLITELISDFDKEIFPFIESPIPKTGCGKETSLNFISFYSYRMFKIIRKTNFNLVSSR
jgi:hypothetical protein